MEKNNVIVTVLDNGPLLVKGTITIVDKDGKSEVKQGSSALCRCGLSKNKPFCDGAHKTCDVLKS